MEDFRSYFPGLNTDVYGKKLVYLDNAATTMRPQSVMDMQRHLQEAENANIHRAVHYLSNVATGRFESARRDVASFIGAEDPSEIVFTSGDTASLNLVAGTFGMQNISEGDEIIVSIAEHHSDFVPWQMLCKNKKAILKILDINEFGGLNMDSLDSLITERTKLIALAHISNVLGVVNPIKEIVAKAHSKGVPVLVDGAQAVAHIPVDVKDLDVDFYTFSGHKMYAATGTGVLYGKKALLEAMPPYMTGGEMVGTVTLEDTDFAPVPHKFEAGTQNFNAIPTLSEAVRIVRESFVLRQQCRQITDFMINRLQAVDGLKLYGVPRGNDTKIPLFSFTVEGAHHEDLALILDKMGIAVRSGIMCAEPLMTRCGVTGMLRASFAPYNTIQEAEYFADALEKAVNMLR